jgi:hypothetical protein
VEASAEGRQDVDGDSADEDLSSYDLLVPVVRGGLLAAYRLETEHGEGGETSDVHIREALQETVWTRMVTTLSFLLRPLDCTKSHVFAPHTEAILEIVSSASNCAPTSICSELGKVLMNGAIQCEDVARLYAPSVVTDARTNTRRDSSNLNRDCEDSLRILKACVSGVCRCDPESVDMLNFLKRILQQALASATTPRQEGNGNTKNGIAASGGALVGQLETHGDVYVDIEMGVVACDSLLEAECDRREVTELVTKLFRVLCQLTNADDDRLRRRAGAALGTYDLIGVVERSRELLAETKSKLDAAEKRVKGLEAEH